MKSYILAWHPYLGEERFERSKLLSKLDQIEEIQNWRANVGAVFISSEADEGLLSDRLHELMPNLRFIISQIDITTTQGRADEKTWDFIRNPRRVGLS
jgi:hypothetical protein